jgi:hypothetical protein
LQNTANHIKLIVLAGQPKVPDQPKELDPFKPEEPNIPGVTGNAARVKQAPKPPPLLAPQSGEPSGIAGMSATRKGLAIGVALICVMGIGFFWRNHSAAPLQADSAPVVAVADLASAPALSQPAAPLPFGPGPIATTSELAKPWSSKRFLFRAPQSAEDVPAIVVRLPGSGYWGISMREPFGTCELEYVTDLQKLQADYHFSADHPMVGDPCNHAVYDLARYGSGPNGMVRGAIVKGDGVRPPIAIEIKARGKQIVATQIEQ